jgi:hypothetical protein
MQWQMGKPVVITENGNTLMLMLKLILDILLLRKMSMDGLKKLILLNVTATMCVLKCIKSSQAKKYNMDVFWD